MFLPVVPVMPIIMAGVPKGISVTAITNVMVPFTLDEMPDGMDRGPTVSVLVADSGFSNPVVTICSAI